MRKITEIGNFMKKRNNLVWSDIEGTINTNVEIVDFCTKAWIGVIGSRYWHQS